MNLSPLPIQKFFDNAGSPLNGGLLFTYVANSSTKLATYQNQGGTPNTNPIVLDFRGEANVWLDQTLTYKFVLAPSTDTDPPTNPIWSVDNVSAAVTFASLTQQIIGQILFPRTQAEITAAVVPTNYAIPSHAAIDDFLIERYGGGVASSASANVTAVTAATAVASAAGGGTVQFPAGTLSFNGPITPLFGVNWRGAAKYATTLSCTMANGVATSNIWINGRGSGSGGFPLDRKIFTISHLTLDGTNAGNQVKCLALGWNMRSMPLLQSVRIAQFADYGVGFLDQNWNIDFIDVEVDTCGKTVANSTGWYKDPAVDGGTFNYINWYNCITEACGTASSTAGGMNLQTTTANRGFGFIACEWENNRGTDQVLISKTADVYFSAPYLEMPAVAAEAVTGIELSGCTGAIDGGFISATDANNDQGLQFKGSCQMSIRNIHFGTTWAVASVDVQGSVIENRNCLKAVGTHATFNLDSSAEIYGDVRPFWMVTSNADQTGIVDSTFTKVQWQTESADLTSCFDNATNYRATPRTRGWYSNDVQVRWDTNVTAFDSYLLVVEVNGVTAKEKLLRPTELAAFEQQSHFDVNLTATTDYIEIFVRHVDGGVPANRTLKTGATVTWWKGELSQVKVS